MFSFYLTIRLQNGIIYLHYYILNGDFMKNISKKIISCILSVLLLSVSIIPATMVSSATDYAKQLESKGFPQSYISALTELHKKYPDWQFEPFKTGLKWDDAVKGERSNHSKQLIQKSSSLSSAYYCDCSKCKKNGSYVIQEGSSWVSASERAVKYYMDPRNWLDEKHIFQFESTSYDKSQTQAGVESILKGTWMHNADITYVNTSGKNTTYKNSDNKTVKYSKAIIDGAEKSNMSAYYLASKIVQEVGGTKATAGGVVGTRKPFVGIYNYYNIGAYSGAMEGLEWGSGFLKTTKKTTLYSSYDSSTKKAGGTATSVAEGQYMSYISKSGDYYKVKLYTSSGNSYSTDGKTGYIKIADLRTTYFNYGRPWTNPYSAIYYGATYIANSFSKYQNTGYLQKFNVNKDSGNLYSHEYMANVQAAASESTINYKAYSNAGILKSAKTFYIPIYNSMPSSKCTMSSDTSTTVDKTTTTTTSSNKKTPKTTGLKFVGRTSTSLKYSWTKVSGAKKYYIYIVNNINGNKFDKTVTTNSASLNNLLEGNKYTVKVRAYTSNGWGDYSTTLTNYTSPSKVSGLAVSSSSTTSIKIKWNKNKQAKGYYVYKYSDSDKKYVQAAKITNPSTTSYTFKNLKAGTKYQYAVYAYMLDGKSEIKSSKAELIVASKPNKVTLKSLSTTKNKIKVNWKKISGSASGYQIYWSDDSKFKHIISKTDISNTSTVTYTGKNLNTGKKYYIKIRAYKTVNGKKFYGSWSSVKSIKCK